MTPSSHPRATHLPIHLALFGITVVWGLNLSVVKSLTQILDLSLIAMLRMLACVACLTVLYRHKIGLIRHWHASLWAQATLAGVLMVYVNLGDVLIFSSVVTCHLLACAGRGLGADRHRAELARGHVVVGKRSTSV